MKSIFIADLHLSGDRPNITRAFNQFLEGLPEDIGELFILGDLFEIWIGDDDPSHFSKAIIQSIKRVSQSGIRTYFQPGNRDFMVGKRFLKETGCRLLPDFSVHSIRGHKVLLTHGDLLCIDDVRYQRYRRRIQFPPVTWCIQHMPLKARQKLGSKIRSTSLEQVSNKSENIMDVNLDEVIRRMDQFDCNLMIHGHTHRPKVHNLEVQGEPSKRYTLGDWDTHLWWVEVDSEKLELRSQTIDGQVNW